MGRLEKYHHLAYGRDEHQGNGIWKYLYCAGEKQVKTVDFLLTAKRDMAAAKHFFYKAMEANGDPDKAAMDKSRDDKVAIDAINAGRDLPILARQAKDLNNIVEQDYRDIKRTRKPMLNFNHSAPQGPCSSASSWST